MAHSFRPLGIVLTLVLSVAHGIPVRAQPSTKTVTTVYDIGDLIAKRKIANLAPFGGAVARPWNAFKEQAHLRNVTLPEKSARLVQALVGVVDGIGGERAEFEQANIQVLNGTKLVIRASADAHAEIASLLAALRRLGNLAVIVNTKLYEVDDAFYTKLKNAKPIDWEEQEKIFLGQAPAKPANGPWLLDMLEKQKPIQVGNEDKIDNGQTATLLSRQHAVSVGANREQVVAGQKQRQAILEGVVLSAGIRVSPDRRYVRLQLTEKATDIRQIKKVKVMVTNDGKELEAEVPFTSSATHQREFEIPDGGTMLVPVHHRPKALADKNRWWVLSITPRIWIEEEEQQIRLGALEAITPLIVADVLKNPRLKAHRDLIGTTGDKRFALLNSTAWEWPKEFKADVPGFERTEAKRAGQRLLGIRVDQLQEAVKEGDADVLTVSLVNAGGSDNGAVVGSSTLRYRARSGEKGWSIELAE